MCPHKLVAACASVATLVAASPAAASADLSLKRAEREAIRAVAPQQVESAFCLRTQLVGRKRRLDRAVCIVSTTAPPGQQCTTLVFVRKQSGLRGAAAIRVQKVHENVCIPKPAPLGSPESL